MTVTFAGEVAGQANAAAAGALDADPDDVAAAAQPLWATVDALHARAPLDRGCSHWSPPFTVGWRGSRTLLSGRDDTDATRLEQGAEPVDLGRHAGVLQVAGEALDGGGTELGVADFVDAAQGLFSGGGRRGPRRRGRRRRGGPAAGFGRSR